MHGARATTIIINSQLIIIFTTDSDIHKRYKLLTLGLKMVFIAELCRSSWKMPFIQQYMGLDNLSNVLLTGCSMDTIYTYTHSFWVSGKFYTHTMDTMHKLLNQQIILHTPYACMCTCVLLIACDACVHVQRESLQFCLIHHVTWQLYFIDNCSLYHMHSPLCNHKLCLVKLCPKPQHCSYQLLCMHTYLQLVTFEIQMSWHYSIFTARTQYVSVLCLLLILFLDELLACACWQ